MSMYLKLDSFLWNDDDNNDDYQYFKLRFQEEACVLLNAPISQLQLYHSSTLSWASRPQLSFAECIVACCI